MDDFQVSFGHEWKAALLVIAYCPGSFSYQRYPCQESKRWTFPTPWRVFSTANRITFLQLCTRGKFYEVTALPGGLCESARKSLSSAGKVIRDFRNNSCWKQHRPTRWTFATLLSSVLCIAFASKLPGPEHENVFFFLVVFRRRPYLVKWRSKDNGILLRVPHECRSRRRGRVYRKFRPDLPIMGPSKTCPSTTYTRPGGCGSEFIFSVVTEFFFNDQNNWVNSVVMFEKEG